MPIGGLGRELGRADELRFRAPVADVPLRTDFPDPPGGREIDLVILGESSAEGVPFNNRMNSGAWRAICLWGISFNNLVAPLTYNPNRRLEARLASAVAAERIAAGAAPESLGLPNIGTPAPVPWVPLTVVQGKRGRSGSH
jgi:hypothetical protein